jgi:glyoxylase I family protein
MPGLSASNGNHVNLTVTNLERSVDWYRQTFGLTVIGDETSLPPASDESMRYRALASFDAMSYIVGLIEHGGGTADRFDERRTGLDHLALHVPDASELKAWEEHLNALGVEHSGVKTLAYGSGLTVRDPDGIQLELFAPNPEYWTSLFIKAAESPAG